ncbi:DegT/DnrJ/EryC1/StrS family aminotransferase [Bacillus massilinigeriensis]|uniref:DegT/DnrJ/EryC1/StrS family aminotransferase n=1 Tax=Bacillus massilionigeriensis TaxID=1805475 RepID=UPI00096B484B|nr:DegT/DnrJ/EryC1/StrS family aminotransferase [Bacillus massilionigeriensis]
MIPVTQPFLPPIGEYQDLLSKIWDEKWITNHGPIEQELERMLEEFLHVPSLTYVSNGTMALQLAIKSLGIRKQVITTPFSFVATLTSILWENCEPVFVDIDPRTLCIDANKIEEAITEDTEAILATHVYGIPCEVEKIETIAKKHKIKVIYDAAHAFGVKYKGKSILTYGDLSILSFHATKLFHTVEGGAIINNLGKKLGDILKRLRNFGFEGDSYEFAGINAKNSELHAAMGICNLKYVEEIIQKRKEASKMYDLQLDNRFARPYIANDVSYNYCYYPIILESEEDLLKIKENLEEHQIVARRYFYPSLNRLSYITSRKSCPISEDISKKVLCLPLYSELSSTQIEKITDLVIGNTIKTI